MKNFKLVSAFFLILVGTTKAAAPPLLPPPGGENRDTVDYRFPRSGETRRLLRPQGVLIYSTLGNAREPHGLLGMRFGHNVHRYVRVSGGISLPFARTLPAPFEVFTAAELLPLPTAITPVVGLNLALRTPVTSGNVQVVPFVSLGVEYTGTDGFYLGLGSRVLYFSNGSESTTHTAFNPYAMLGYFF